ncbi:MAG: ParD-like family protein [Actinobacteria bacterium]|nr:ParD-like family protein [Actinomycetota bacterium]
MAKTSSTPTRVADDVATTAKAVALAENRSTAEQISHWARIGMQVERSGSVANRRVLAVAAGQAQFSSLTDDERVAAHAMVDARISELAAAQSFGAAARDEGHSTVSLDEDGNLIEIGADGRRRPL